MWRRGVAAATARGTRGVVSRAQPQPHRNTGHMNARPVTPQHQQQHRQAKKPPQQQQRRFFAWRTSRPIAWLIANAMPLATYQLFLEAGCTGVCGWMLLHGRTTDDMQAGLSRWRYPFAGLIDWDGGRHAEDITVAGCRIDAATLTALHTGHNIANGLIPLQVAFLALTYPAVARAAAVVAQTPMVARVLEKKSRSMAKYTKKGYVAPAETTTSHPFGKPRRPYCQ